MKCKHIAIDTGKEDCLISIINENLISTLDNKILTMKLPFLIVNHLTRNIEDLYYNNSFELTINYSKQAIDISYSTQKAQDIRLLKICNFCEKAFINKYFRLS